MKNKISKQVYLVYGHYFSTPMLEGVYSTREKAEKKRKNLNYRSRIIPANVDDE